MNVKNKLNINMICFIIFICGCERTNLNSKFDHRGLIKLTAESPILKENLSGGAGIKQ